MSEPNGIYAAMAGVMNDVDAISKSQNNAQQGFKYRGIDDVYNAMHSILAKHSIFTLPEVLSETREERTNKNGTVLAFTGMIMKYTFCYKDGSSVFCTVKGEGMDSGDKSSNKAMAVAHKYALTQCFCIPTEDAKDPDAETHAIAPKAAQQKQPQQAAPVPIADLLKRVELASTAKDLDDLWNAHNANLDEAQKRTLLAAGNKRKKEIFAAPVQNAFPGAEVV